MVLSSYPWSPASRAAPAVLLLATIPAPDVPARDWTVLPDSVEFGSVAVDGWHSVLFRARNDGDQALTLEPSLEDTAGVFMILPQTGPTVAPGGIYEAGLGFSPTADREYSGVLHLGAGAPEVPLHGRGIVPFAGCLGAVDAIDFGTVPAGGTARSTFLVANTGTSYLWIEPTVVGEYAFSPFAVSSSPAGLDAGQDGFVTVICSPDDRGTFRAELRLGPDACAAIPLRADGLRGQPGNDLMVVSFAPDHVDRYAFTDVPDTVMQAYLALANPTFAAGVYAWETRIETSPGLQLLGVQPRGQAMNLAASPDFVVGLASPLPPSDCVVLADLQIMVSTTDFTYIRLTPPTVSSLGDSPPGPTTASTT